MTESQGAELLTQLGKMQSIAEANGILTARLLHSSETLVFLTLCILFFCCLRRVGK